MVKRVEVLLKMDVKEFIIVVIIMVIIKLCMFVLEYLKFVVVYNYN